MNCKRTCCWKCKHRLGRNRMCVDKGILSCVYDYDSGHCKRVRKDGERCEFYLEKSH